MKFVRHKIPEHMRIVHWNNTPDEQTVLAIITSKSPILVNHCSGIWVESVDRNNVRTWLQGAGSLFQVGSRLVSRAIMHMVGLLDSPPDHSL